MIGANTLVTHTLSGSVTFPAGTLGPIKDGLVYICNLRNSRGWGRKINPKELDEACEILDEAET